MSGVNRDISERKRFEAELTQAKEAAETALAQSQRLITIIESTPDMVGMANMQGEMIYGNRAIREGLGITLDEDMTGIPIMSFYTPESAEQLMTVGIPHAIQHGSWSGEAGVVHQRDGHVIPVSLAGVIHYDEAGHPAFMSAVLRDITERKRFEAEITQAKDAAETANRAKSAFLANMSPTYLIASRNQTSVQ